jgi:defect-in-organelle-trafficking protein DotB
MSEQPFIDDAHPFDLPKLKEALLHLYEWGIDDILIQDQERLAVQRHGRIIDVGNRPLELDTVQNLLNQMYKQTASATLQQAIDHNFTLAVEKDRKTTYRFRVNASASMGMYSNPLGCDITMRSIAQLPPELDQLGVQDDLREALFPRTGIVLVGGATGSGKSTTLGAIIQDILRDPEGKRVLTYESPIEFDFRAIPGRTGRIAQSDVYVHLKDYAHATSNALRRHPDVIVLGEARDAETISGAIHNSETGHTVYSTVHVNSVPEMLTRMIGVFPANERMRALSGLIGSTRVLMYQALLPTVDGGRCAIREWLVLTDEMRKDLYSVPEEKITAVMTELLATHGRPLIKDVREHYQAGRLSKTIYDRMEAEVGQ